jgi:riboflavin kinase/FMN adenylyltransferase
MDIIYDSNAFSPKKKTIVTVGTFDGVHLGHQKIIKQLVDEARKKDLAATLLTFDPHPRKVVQPDTPMALIQTIEERAQALKSLGLDYVVIHPFTRAFAQLSAEEYVKELLVDTLNVAHIVVGYNHRFGKNRGADYADLERFGRQYNFEVTQISAKEIDDVSVSSTKIRKALLDGDIATVHRFLGRPFRLIGKVVAGQQKGRTIGFPTANLIPINADKIIPKNGVYAVHVSIDDTKHLGMMNIGTNPTVNGQSTNIEIHLINWTGDLYHQTISVSLIDRLRDEKKFDSLDDLKKQLEKDKESIWTAYNTLPL